MFAITFCHWNIQTIDDGYLVTTHVSALPKNVQPLYNGWSWVFSKTSHSFSFIPLDQVNEHNVKVMKGPRGIIGLKRDPNLFYNWATLFLLK